MHLSESIGMADHLPNDKETTTHLYGLDSFKLHGLVCSQISFGTPLILVKQVSDRSIRAAFPLQGQERS